MKIKIFALSLLAALTLTACNNNWEIDTSGLEPGFIEHKKGLIEKNMATLEEKPDDFTAIFEIAHGYQMIGEYRKSIEYYEKTLALDPGYFSTLNNMADIYEQVEEYDLAAKYIKDLYNRNQSNQDVVTDTVRILLKAGEPDNAKVALESFIQAVKDEQKEVNPQLISDLFQSIVDYKNTHEK